MKRYILKIGLFSILCLVVANVAKLFVSYDYYWGNDIFKNKITHLENKLANNNLDENVYFFGSSRIYRQIDPDIFDALTTDKSLKSYNLGSKGTFAPQSYYLYRNFLKSELSNTTKYAFLELTDIFPSAKRNLGADRSSYWQNWKDYGFILKSVSTNKSYSLKNKVGIISTHSVSFFLKLFQFKQYKSIFIDDTSSESQVGSYIEKNGFQSLDDELSIEKDSLQIKTLLKRKAGVENGKFKKNMALAKKAFEGNAQIDTVQLEAINALIKSSRDKSIHLIFVFPPFRPSSNLDILYKNIDDKHKIEAANPNDYPSLFKKDNFFDEGHLNKKGAQLHTAIIADKFNKLLE